MFSIKDENIGARPVAGKHQVLSLLLPCCVSLFLSSILTYVWWARCLLAVFCIYFIICTYLFNVVLHCIWSQSCSLIIQHLPASVRPCTGRLDLAHPWEDVEIFVIIKWVFSAGTGFFFFPFIVRHDPVTSESFPLKEASFKRSQHLEQGLDCMWCITPSANLGLWQVCLISFYFHYLSLNQRKLNRLRD